MAAVVPAVDEVLDGSDEVADAGEASAADGLAGDDPEEDLDHVEPGPGGRGEVQGDPGVPCQPGLHVGMLAGGVVTGHDVQLPARVGPRDLAEEPQELLVAVPGAASVGDLAGGDFQGGEQRGGAVPDVVTGL